MRFELSRSRNEAVSFETRRQLLRAPNSRETGSALLIVLVFAAIVAIMLYKEIPDIYFEAQRQKEQLLIDRGNEYKTAIKRFYTKNSTFPTSLDQLDNFNNIRYLRHHYKDPMTGKNEWRLVHVMNPGFVLTDSKVTPPNANGAPGAPGSTGANAVGAAANGTTTGGFGQPANGAAPTGFGSSNTASSFGSSSNSSFSSGGFGGNNSFGQSTSSFNQAETDPNAPPQPSAAQLYGAHQQQAPAPISALSGGQAEDNPDQTSSEKPLPGPGEPNTLQGENGPVSAPAAAGAAGANPGQPGAASPNAPAGTDPNNPAASALQAVNSNLRQQQPVPNQAFASSNSSNHTISGGGIAGIASTGKGSTIKVLDKQKDYEKWEFVYNPQQDNAKKLQGALGANGQNPNAGSPSGSTTNTSPGGFGQSTSNNSFGSNSNSFGSSSSSSSTSSFGSSSAPAPSSNTTNTTPN